MEEMPFQEWATTMARTTVRQPRAATQPANEWQRSLPVLEGDSVTVRELRAEDAPSLLALLTTDEVTRFISPPPTTLSGFERFIAWTHRERAAGNYVCFGIVPRGMQVAVGLIQVRKLERAFNTGEWGFVLGSAFWGTGVFVEAAELVADFVFDRIGAHRLEARAVLRNGRGNGALRKLGAVQEGVLRASFLRNGEYLDQALWTIVDSEWRSARPAWVPRVH
jgi:RimJ/RimL family protein N-acetyltransferase